MDTRGSTAVATPTRSGVVPRVLLGVAVVALVAGALGCAAHFWAAGTAYGLGLVAATPYLLIGAPVALVVAAIGRRWVVVGLAAVVGVVGSVTQGGLYVATTAPRDARDVVVMTANLRLGQANPDAVVAAVRRHHVQVLMLEELTPTEQDALLAAGLLRVLPHGFSIPGTGAIGTGLWSAFPLYAKTRHKQFTFAFLSARVDLPGTGVDPTAVALHLAGPVPDASYWVRDVGRLPAALAALPHDAPVLVGGDFNATPDTVQFRDALTGGYDDAADEAGAGRTETYPSDRSFPPLIAIDHVLTRGGAVATDVRTLEIPGSDHRALLTSIAVPTGSA